MTCSRIKCTNRCFNRQGSWRPGAGSALPRWRLLYPGRSPPCSTRSNMRDLPSSASENKSRSVAGRWREKALLSRTSAGHYRKEGVFRRWFGYAEVKVHVLTSESDKHFMLHPLLKTVDIPAPLNRVTPQFSAQPITASPPPRANGCTCGGSWLLPRSLVAHAFGILTDSVCYRFCSSRSR